MQTETEIAVIGDAARFEELRADWNRLLKSSGSNGVFLTWEWLFTWWKHLSGGRRLSILAVHRDRKLVALAPLALRPAGLKGLSPLRFLEFLGTGSVGSDYLDLIIARGREPEALASLAGDMARRKYALDLRQVDRASGLAAELAGKLRTQNGWSVAEKRTDLCPFITLSGHSWESYLASLGSQHRYNFQRRLRNLRKRFDVRFEPARTEEERRRAMDILIDLHHSRWRGRGGSDGLHTPALLAFHQDFSRLALSRGWLRLFVLWLDGRPAAALYGLCYGGVFYFYQSGFDSAYSRESVGLVTMGLAIQSAIEEGAKEYDLLHGDEAYKFQWAPEVRELARIEMYPPCLSGHLQRRSADLGRAFKQFAWRVLPKTLAARIAAARRTGAWKGLYAAEPR